MTLPVGVLMVYAALVVWLLLLLRSFKLRSFGAFINFGIVFLLALNIRYFIEGAPNAIAFFIGIYDVLDNFGASAGAAALASCPDNACSVWGDRYHTHPGGSHFTSDLQPVRICAALCSTAISASILWRLC